MLSAGPTSTLGASRCHGDSEVARATASRGPAIHHGSGAGGGGGALEGLSCAPVLVTTREQYGEGRDGGMEVAFLGRLRTLSLCRLAMTA